MKYLISINNRNIANLPVDFMDEVKSYDRHDLVKGAEIYVPEPTEHINRIAEQFREKGYCLQIHSIDMDEGMEIKDLLKYYNSITNVLILHPVNEKTPELSLYRTDKLLKRIGKIAYGIYEQAVEKPLTMSYCIENLNPKSDINRCNIFHCSQLLQENNLCFCWDIGHEVDRIDKRYSSLDIALDTSHKYYYALPLLPTKRLRAVHLHNLNGNGDHCPFKKDYNAVDYTKALDFLKAINYQYYITLEVAFDYLQGDNKLKAAVEQIELIEGVS
jgi:hypothetical protein